MEKEIIYLKLEQNVELSNQKVLLGDLGTIYCNNKQIQGKARALNVINMQHTDRKRVVVSTMKIIESLEQLGYPIIVQSIGATDVVIEVVKGSQASKVMRILKITFVCMICFFGTSFTIMSYHNDIGINDLFSQYYKMVTGKSSTGYTILELSYSIGLAVGILTFFNHIGKRKITKDPTPIEVQMTKYENDVNTSLVETASKGGTTIDVS
ncbi:MAG: stage V sporulation protein AA [Eubacteriales bacterium]